MPLMHVPETAVHKDYCSILRQNYIRRTGIAFIVLAVSEAVREEKFSDEAFRFCVGAPYAGHVVMPLFLCQSVSRFQFLPSGCEKSIKYSSSSSL